MSARCPETGRACSTAYGRHKCRCSTCVAWKSDYAAGRGSAEVITPTQQAEVAARHAGLHAEFDAAVRIDPNYAIEIARAFHKL